MSAPITREDFIRIGEHHTSEAIVDEIDRLVPIATADKAQLEAGGYGPELFAELVAHRAALTSEVAQHRAERGAKKGARVGASQAVRGAKRVLRAAIAMVDVALQHRPLGPGETVAQAQAIAASLGAKLDALSGRIGEDSAKARTRLTAVLELLKDPALAPAPSNQPARDARIAEVAAALLLLPAAAEEKAGAQQVARLGTSHLDELDGRAYHNLKSLVKVGREQWRAAGDARRAAEYQLHNLNARTPKATPDVPPTPAPADS